MKCIEVQRLIMPFINGKLSLEELEAFLSHIEDCPDCFEELEVYYALISGMRQLDEDKELSNDFHKDLILLIRNSEERIKNHKVLHIRKKVGLILVILLVALGTSYSFGEYVINDKEEASVYQYEDLFHLNNRYLSNRQVPQLLESQLPKELEGHVVNIYRYLLHVDEPAAKRLMELSEYKLWLYDDYPSGIGTRDMEPKVDLVH